MTGQELTTFITGLNGGATIDPTLLDVLVDNARAVIEAERSWMVLRKTDTSISLATSNTWQTAKSLAGITDFNRFYGELPIRLFDGTSRIDYYALKPFDRRLEYKDVGGTAVFDENASILYLNGTPAFAGTLYVSYVANSPDIDLTSSSAIWTNFPARFASMLGYYAVGIFKGAVDYDSINRLMLPANGQALEALKAAMVAWDNDKQLSTLETNDPANASGYPRAGAINRDEH